MTRHELREVIFKRIFQLPFQGEEVPQIDITEDYKVKEDDLLYINDKVEAIIEKLDTIDESIEKNSNGWKTTRMGKAELAILRVAVYEIKYDDDIPDKVAVNEAVELAKEYCDEKSAPFINGVLSGVIAQ
ncbi:MAG: transcription antitermination factor NusB [Eubacterium sp.]|nr:transcription antitermination factor NusB [Eubacterium sp.]